MIDFTLTEQNSGTNESLIAISILDDSTVWMSGKNSTFLRTKDGGQNWEKFQHPTIKTFQYRDIHAFDQDNVVLMSVGNGNESQIHLYSAQTGWDFLEVAFVMDHPDGFLDSIAFWDKSNGLAYGDSFDNKPYILKTDNGGHSWNRIDPSILPESLKKGEGGFASSGSCIAVFGQGIAWIGTGSNGNARILKTTDYGQSWESFETPIIKGESAGITGVHFINENQGFITGGDLAITDEYTDNIAFSEDGGQTWTLNPNHPVTKGAFYGGDIINFGGQTVALACGPNGADVTFDAGQTWQSISTNNLWVSDFTESGKAWLAGTQGKILKLELQ